MMPYLLAHAAGLAARLSDGLLDELDEGAGRYQVRRARVNGHGPRTPVISTHHELEAAEARAAELERATRRPHIVTTHTGETIP